MSSQVDPIQLAQHEIESFIGARHLVSARLQGPKEVVFRRFFEHVAAHVPAWNRLTWKGSIAATLSHSPVLLREYVARDPSRYRSDVVCGPEIIKTTSGFTGTPITVVYDRFAAYLLNTVLYERLLSYFPDLRSMLRPGTFAVALVTNKPDTFPVTALVPALNWSLWQKIPLNDQSSVDELVKSPPPIIYGKPMYIRDLIDILQITNVALKPLCILTSGEKVYGDDRAEIKKWLGADIIDSYTSTESGIIAISPPGSDKLVVTDQTFVEVRQRDGLLHQDGEGELIVTSVFNWAYPLLRYDTGDVGCVRLRNGKQIIEKIGRKSELNVLASARRTAELDEYMASFGIWDYRFRIVNGSGFLIWASRLEGLRFSQDALARFKKLSGCARCMSRRVQVVTRRGEKRMRYPSGKLSCSDPQKLDR